jgi:hypothetical protein
MQRRRRDDQIRLREGIYHQGLMVGETPNIDRIGEVHSPTSFGFIHVVTASSFTRSRSRKAARDGNGRLS